MDHQNRCNFKQIEMAENLRFAALSMFMRPENNTLQMIFLVCLSVCFVFFSHLCCALPAPTGSAPGPWSRPPSAPGCLPEACTCPGFSSFGTRSQSTSRCRRCFGSGQYLKSKKIKKKTWFSFKFDLSVVAQYVLQAPLNWWTEGDKRSLCHVNN